MVPGNRGTAHQSPGLWNTEALRRNTHDLPIAAQKLVTKEAAPVGVIKFLVWLSNATAAAALKKRFLNQLVHLRDTKGAVGPLAEVSCSPFTVCFGASRL